MEDLARMELERGEYLSPMFNKETREGLSQCIGDCLEWLDLSKPTHGQVKTPNSELRCLVSLRIIASLCCAD